MTGKNDELARELKRYQTLDHPQCEELAQRYGKSVRLVIAKAVASGVTYLPRGQRNISKKKQLENEERAAKIEALQGELARRKLEEGSQPFTTGIFHPMAFPIVMLILLIAGIAAAIKG